MAGAFAMAGFCRSAVMLPCSQRHLGEAIVLFIISFSRIIFKVHLKMILFTLLGKGLVSLKVVG